MQRLAAGPTHALGKVKSLLRQSFANSLKAQLDAESEALTQCAATREFVEGVDGFLEKRAAVFEGR